MSWMLAFALGASLCQEPEWARAPLLDLRAAGKRWIACTACGVAERRGGEPWRLLAEAPFRLTAVAADPADTSGSCWAAGGVPGESGWIARFDAEGELLVSRRVAADLVYDLDVANGVLVLGDAAGRVVRLAASTLEDEILLERHTAPCLAVRFDPSGRWLVSGGLDANLLRFDLESDEPPLRLLDHGAGVQAIAWSPDGTSFASGARDGKVRWHDREGRLLRSSQPLPAAITALAWGGEPGAVLAGLADGSVCQLHPVDDRWRRTGSEVRSDPGSEPVRALLPEGSAVWSARGGPERLVLPAADEGWRR